MFRVALLALTLSLFGACRTRPLDGATDGFSDERVDLAPVRDLALVDLSPVDLGSPPRDLATPLDLTPPPNVCQQIPNGTTDCTLVGSSPEGPNGCIISSLCAVGVARVVCNGVVCFCESNGQNCATYPQGNTCTGTAGRQAAWDRCAFP